MIREGGVVRILFVTYFFPPFRTMGAVRTGQTAKYLLEMGHDVQILAARDQSAAPTLPVEVPAERVTWTPWLGSQFIVPTAQGARPGDNASERKSILGSATGTAGQLLKFLQRHIVYAPDGKIGWFPFAVPAGKRLVSAGAVDLIYASSMPITSLLVAAEISRQCRVPWIGELRDLWSQNYYRNLPTWQRCVDRFVERKVLASASGLVTVSEPLADVLRRSYTPVTVVSNGFEERRRSEREVDPDPQRLSIVYTGVLYEGKQDPTPLFHAIRSLGDKGKRVDVSFFGTKERLVAKLARSEGVEDRVRVFGEVPYEESLDVQARSDVLLLLLWNQPGEEGVMPGKLFEYMAAGRPILAIGTSRGVAVDLVRSRSLGFASLDPHAIGQQLALWLEEKSTTGRVAPIPAEARCGYDRLSQTKKLVEFLESVLRHNEGTRNRRREGHASPHHRVPR